MFVGFCSYAHPPASLSPVFGSTPEFLGYDFCDFRRPPLISLLQIGRIFRGDFVQEYGVVLDSALPDIYAKMQSRSNLENKATPP